MINFYITFFIDIKIYKISYGFEKFIKFKKGILKEVSVN